MRIPAAVFLGVSLLCCRASAVTLEFVHSWPNANRTVQALANRYRQQTGVTVRVRAVSPTSRMTWRSSGGPDLAGLYQPDRRDIAQMAAQGLILDLRTEMSRGWYAILWPGMLDTFSIRTSTGTGIYGVPLTGQVHVFIYNKQYFRRAGVGVPRTWSELMAVSRKLRALKITPYAGGFGSNMPPLAGAYEYAYLGSHLLTQTYLGRYPYTSPYWLAYLNLYTEMRRNGFTTTAAASMSNAAAIRAFLDGRVAMIFTNTQYETMRRAYKPAFTGWGAFGAPDDPRARFVTKAPGSVVAGLVINRRSPRRAQAIAFARWLTEYNQQLTLANSTTTIPAMTVASQTFRLSDPLQQFANAGVRDVVMDLRINENPRVLATLYSGVRSIIGNKSSPAAVARRTQRVKAGK